MNVIDLAGAVGRSPVGEANVPTELCLGRSERIAMEPPVTPIQAHASRVLMGL